MQGENFPARPCLAPAKSACCRRALISQNCACSGKICLLQALFCKAVSAPRQSMPVAGECFFAELCMVQKNLPAVGGCFSQSCACPRKSLSVAGAFLQGRVCSPAKHACCRRMFFRRAVHGSEKSASSRRVLFCETALAPGKVCLLQALFYKAVSAPRQSMPVASVCFSARRRCFWPVNIFDAVMVQNRPFSDGGFLRYTV